MNILENPIMIQLIHRKLGILLLLCIFLLWLTPLQNINQTSKTNSPCTISNNNPNHFRDNPLVYIMSLMPLAVLHQLTATILLTIMIWFNHSIIYK